MLHKNLLTEQHHSFIQSGLLSSNFPWYYEANIHTGALTSDHKNNTLSSGFFHRFYDNQQQNSQSFYLVLPYIYSLLEKNNMEMETLLRIRGFLSVPSIQQHTGFPHVDIPNFCESGVPYKTAIVYVAGFDGDTIFYDETFDGRTTPKPEELKEISRITPEPNSGVIFDGDRYHTGLLPETSKVRVLLNFNFTVKDKTK